MTDTTYGPLTYRKQGGDEFVVASGGKVSIETGGDIEVNGVSLIDEVAALSGLDSGELGVLNGVTAGTGAASKAMILDSGEDFTWPATGLLTYGGTAITANGAEINYLDLASLGTGAASKAVVLDANGAYVGPTGTATKLTWNVTSTSTDGGTSVEPFVHNTTMTGVGGVGGRGRFELDTNVALGAWSNALKAQAQYGATGKTTGLGSAFVAEMILSAGTVDGTYAPLEIELGIPSGASTGAQTSFMYMSANDTPAAFDTAGYLMSINGLTAGSGKVFNSGLSQVVTAAARLRINIGGTEYFIPLCAVEALTS